MHIHTLWPRHGRICMHEGMAIHIQNANTNLPGFHQIQIRHLTCFDACNAAAMKWNINMNVHKHNDDDAQYMLYSVMQKKCRTNCIGSPGLHASYANEICLHVIAWANEITSHVLSVLPAETRDRGNAHDHMTHPNAHKQRIARGSMICNFCLLKMTQRVISRIFAAAHFVL